MLKIHRPMVHKSSRWDLGGVLQFLIQNQNQTFSSTEQWITKSLFRKFSSFCKVSTKWEKISPTNVEASYCVLGTIPSSQIKTKTFFCGSHRSPSYGASAKPNSQVTGTILDLDHIWFPWIATFWAVTNLYTIVA